MPKDNIADSILSKINKRVGSVANRLSVQYKGVKPFDSQPMKTEDQLYWYDQLGTEDMQFLIEKHGEDAINTYIFDNEQIRQRRSRNG